MRDGGRGTPLLTAGLNLGDKDSYVCLIDTDSGKVLQEGRLRTTPEALRRRFSSEQRVRVAIEAGTHSPWVSRVLKECGHEVLVANPRKRRLIYGQARKTDRLDAEKLARLARVDPKLLSLLEHRGEASQAHLALIRLRAELVRSRAQLINHLRGTVKSIGARLRESSPASFNKKVAACIPEELQQPFRARSAPPRPARAAPPPTACPSARKIDADDPLVGDSQRRYFRAGRLQGFLHGLDPAGKDHLVFFIE